jgi:hypothetical protein
MSIMSNAPKRPKSMASSRLGVGCGSSSFNNSRAQMIIAGGDSLCYDLPL